MNRSINSIKKRRPIEKRKSDINFAPIAIKCSILTDVSNPLSKTNPSPTTLNLHAQKTLKTINRISGNTNHYLSKIKNSKITEVDEHRSMEQELMEIDQMEIEKQKQAENLVLEQGKNRRKNVYRSRRERRNIKSRPKLTVSKTKNIENKKLIMYFRYQLLTLINCLGKKEEYLNCLRKKTLVYPNNPPLKPLEIQHKLQKQLDGKGKDKARKNFNNLTNQQLKSLNYKPRQTMASSSTKKDKMQKDEEQSINESAEEEDEAQDYPDMQTWKRKNHVHQNCKVFIVKGGYSELRNQLINRGWVQNEDVYSKHYDMKWTTKISDIDYGNLRNGQIVNHFNNNHHLTSKYGLTKRLRALFINYGIDSDQFYPRCYDLGDQTQLENFIEEYKFTFAESLAHKVLEQREKYSGKTYLLQTLLSVLEKRYLSLAEKVKQAITNNYPVVTPAQWQTITSEQPNNQEQITNQNQQDLHDQIQKLLYSKNSQLFSQNQQKLTRTHNSWIAKPNFLSRGRGIRCFNESSLTTIADYCLGRQTQFVIQKYIENPLLINNKKFDIRVWVVVIDYNPARIYYYEESYLRFCTEEYNIGNITNRYVHLTNNSIQKHNKTKKNDLNESMWHIGKFIEHVGEESWASIKEKIQNIVVWSIKAGEGAVTSKKGSFQFFGFDFMIDEEHNPWLIEINMSPSMDYSTPVTKKIVKAGLKDTANLIVNNYNNFTNGSQKNLQKIGNFTCIYKGDQDLSKYNLYNTVI